MPTGGTRSSPHSEQPGHAPGEHGVGLAGKLGGTIRGNAPIRSAGRPLNVRSWARTFETGSGQQPSIGHRRLAVFQRHHLQGIGNLNRHWVRGLRFRPVPSVDYQRVTMYLSRPRG